MGRDRSVLMWLEGFGASWEDVASHLNVTDFLLDGDTQALERALFLAVQERSELFKEQPQKRLSTTTRIVDFYSDPFGFRDVVAGGELPDTDERPREEAALAVQQNAALWEWVDELFVASESSMPE